MNRLTKKIAVVTGAAHGIGEAIAQLFAKEGAWVLATDIDDEAGEAVAAGIRGDGGECVFCHADVSRPEDVKRACTLASQQTGRIDILCNNAAYLGDFHDVLEASDEEWNLCFEVAVMGTQRFTRGVLPYMIEQHAGSVINIVSIQALVGCPTSVAYTATKSALLGFTLSAAYDYGKHNVRVNAICPGPIQTRISPKPGEPAYLWQCEQTVLGRVGSPSEVAYSAVFLASDSFLHHRNGTAR